MKEEDCKSECLHPLEAGTNVSVSQQGNQNLVFQSQGPQSIQCLGSGLPQGTLTPCPRAGATLAENPGCVLNTGGQSCKKMWF